MHSNAVSRRRFLSLTGAAAGGLAVATGISPQFARGCPAIIPDPMQTAKLIGASVNDFAADLHREVSRNEKGTLFCSPFSISAALAMTSAGARDTTLEEMQKTLHLPADPHDGFRALLGHLNNDGGWFRKRPFELSVANAIWAQKGFPWHKEFMELTRMNYGAGMIETNFAESEAARKQINDWVEQETRQKIKELIGAGVISGLTRMVLANAINFKGNWQTQFDKKDTNNAPFTRVDGTKVDVPLMTMTSDFAYGEFNMFVTRRGEKVQVLELPYSGNALSMLVFLPENPTGVHRLPEWLSGGDFARTEFKRREVQVFLPRFKAESSLSLKPVLMNLGMRTAFGKADFTGMSPEGKNLYISHVLHKAFVEVNEEGTEAAAATAVVVKERASLPSEPVVFRADRPFVFTIRDNKTGTVLFLGRYCGPQV